MNLLTAKIKTLYFRYLAAAFGSALISAIYSIVDMAMVGQYHGPDGSAALAVVAPVWNIIYSFGLLMGIGGSVLFSTLRGRAAGQEKASNEYFTSSVIGSVVLAAVIWLVIDKEIISAISKHTALSEQYIQTIVEHTPIRPFPIHIGRSFYAPANPAFQQHLNIYKEQARIIREMASRSDCVIVGRCADYILQEFQPFRLFVYADMDSKIKRCQQKRPKDEALSEKDLRQKIKSIDKQRARYYERYTGKPWGNKLNFDFCINTTQTEIKKIVPAIAKLLE